MTEIFEVEGGTWLDEHRTCDRKATRVFKVQATQSGDVAADLAERTTVIGALMDELAAQPAKVAITGSAWSQSDVFASPAIRIDTGLDRAIWELPASALLPECRASGRHLALATGGAKLHEIMDFLDARGGSFRTAGSHKGQSIAGAIATGTHGSLLSETGLETHVRGLLFVSGSDAAHWIGDPDHPVLTEEFVSGFADLTDPALFPDAVIHLGGLGYCAAVLIEGVERFGLSWAKACAPLPDGWWNAIEAGNFSDAMEHVTNGQEPAFIELTFDPNRGIESDVMQTVYWRDSFSQENAAQRAHPARDTVDILSDRLADIPRDVASPDDPEIEGPGGFGSGIRLLDIPKMIFDDFREDVTQQPNSPEPESLLALTGDWEPRSVFGIRIDTFNAAFSVPLERLRSVLEVGTAVAAKHRKHFVYTVRFAGPSPASLSFLRFERNAIINIDGLTRAGIAGWISHSDEASRAFTDALEDAGIPFSMHWGKDIPSDAAKIAADFGPAVSRYKAVRVALVPEALRAKLCSPMLEHWGLA